MLTKLIFWTHPVFYFFLSSFIVFLINVGVFFRARKHKKSLSILKPFKKSESVLLSAFFSFQFVGVILFITGLGSYGILAGTRIGELIDRYANFSYQVGRTLSGVGAYGAPSTNLQFILMIVFTSMTFLIPGLLIAVPVMSIILKRKKIISLAKLAGFYLFWSTVNFVLLVLITATAFHFSSVIRQDCRDKYFDVRKAELHLADLCLERDDKTECPKNLSELTAFNPEIFKEASKCTDVVYVFSRTKGHILLVRKSASTYSVFSKDPRWPDGSYAGIYSSSEVREIQSTE